MKMKLLTRWCLQTFIIVWFQSVEVMIVSSHDCFYLSREGGSCRRQGSHREKRILMRAVSRERRRRRRVYGCIKQCLQEINAHEHYAKRTESQRALVQDYSLGTITRSRCTILSWSTNVYVKQPREQSLLVYTPVEVLFSCQNKKKSFKEQIQQYQCLGYAVQIYEEGHAL